jgi:hypothetical protein
MNRKLAFTMLALTVVLGSAGTALAAHHKAVKTADPRMTYKFQGANHDTWCDNSADCNGWSKWLTMVEEGKLKIEPLIK